MWSYMSGQFTAACAAKQEATTALFLRHVVSALSSAFHFQTNHPTSLALPLTLSLLAPNGILVQLNVTCVKPLYNDEISHFLPPCSFLLLISITINVVKYNKDDLLYCKKFKYIS